MKRGIFHLVTFSNISIYAQDKTMYESIYNFLFSPFCKSSFPFGNNLSLVLDRFSFHVLDLSKLSLSYQVPDDLLEEAKAAARVALEEMDAD